MRVLTILAFLLPAGVVAVPAYAEPPLIIGWIESVSIQPYNLMVQAKIDTGADDSSIHADDIKVLEKNGVKMVRFTLENKQGETVSVEKPLVRYVEIKRKGAEPQLRPVVMMDLCLGNKLSQTVVNLANRSNFSYRMLVGRSYLMKQAYVVDSNRMHTTTPACTRGST